MPLPFRFLLEVSQLILNQFEGHLIFFHFAFFCSGFGGETEGRCQKCGESESNVMPASVSCFLEPGPLDHGCF